MQPVIQATMSAPFCGCCHSQGLWRRCAGTMRSAFGSSASRSSSLPASPGASPGALESASAVACVVGGEGGTSGVDESPDIGGMRNRGRQGQIESLVSGKGIRPAQTSDELA